MIINVYASFESAGLERILRFWNEQIPLYSSINSHAVGLLPWGATAAIAPDELRVLMLDAAGLRHVLAEGLPEPLRRDGAGRAPIVALFPDDSEQPDSSSLKDSRALLLDVTAISAAAGVRRLLDHESRQIAGLPYTNDCLTAFGTALHRQAYSLLVAAPKVLALDCDGTLWQGLCAEQGPHGIKLGPEEQAMHRFLIDQKRAGRLLVLVSKNILDDVAAVFKERSDLKLRWSDFAALRVGWNDKSQSLRELAQELNVGLDSLVMIDDSPVECAEVRSACPEVVVLQRPRFGVRRFLESVWPLDPRSTPTGSLGEARTRLYQDEARRLAERRDAPSFAEHVRSLAIRTTVAPAEADQRARLFELVQRTNQFNTAADRLSEEAVGAALARGELLSVEVTDRFGDYGLSGAVFVERSAEALRASRMMLSCRVLGRGVEEDLFDALIAMARREKRDFLDFVVATTGRNVPARRFLDSVGDQLTAVRLPGDAAGSVWRFAVTGLAPCPRSHANKVACTAEPRIATGSAPAADWGPLSQWSRDCVALATRVGLSAEVAPDLPISADQQGILQIASEVLGVKVAEGDNLYALGADSLKIVRLLARLKSLVGIQIPLGEILYRADVADLLRLSRIAHTRPAARDDGFFDQVKALYDAELARS